MRKISLFVTLAAFMMLAPALFAQNHGEVGIFADYTRLSIGNSDLNYVGVGGRVGFNVHPNVAIEAEGTWDPNKTYEYNTDTGGTITTYRVGTHLVNFMAGPKFQAGTGAFRAFFTVKGGLLNFAGGNASIVGQINNIPIGDTHGVLYPGGGIEAYAGPIGIRVDVGDEIYFANGAHNNLKISAGPSIRF